MSKTSYEEKLKDPRWQRKRLEIFQRDGWKCWNCGDEKATLHVHHLKYGEGEPWEIDNDLLRTVCENCHTGVHVNGNFPAAIRLDPAEIQFPCLGCAKLVNACGTSGFDAGWGIEPYCEDCAMRSALPGFLEVRQ